MDYDLSKSQKYVGFFLFETVFWVLFLAAGFSGWIPGFGLIAVAVAFLNILIGVAGYYVTRDDGFHGFQTTTKRQLTEKEAYRLVHHMLRFDERFGYSVGRVVEQGIDPAKSPSDDKEDAVRLFKFEFEPLNLSGRATVYMDLEQELSVDLSDDDSLFDAADRVQNIRIVKSWMSSDYAKKVEGVKESLGRAGSATVTVTRTDDGREIRELPAGIQNQGSSNSSSAEAES